MPTTSESDVMITREGVKKIYIYSIYTWKMSDISAPDGIDVTEQC